MLTLVENENAVTEVEIARKHRKWRGEYMTLQEKFDEIREEALKEAREEARKEAQEDIINVILSFIKNGNLSLEVAAKGSGIPVEELRQRLQDNA